MVEARKDYLAMPFDISFRHYILPRVVSRIEGLSIVRKVITVKGRGRAGDPIDGNMELTFINGPEDKRILCQSILEDIGCLDQDPVQRERNLDWLTNGLRFEEVGDLIDLEVPDVLIPEPVEYVMVEE